MDEGREGVQEPIEESAALEESDVVVDSVEPSEEVADVSENESASETVARILREAQEAETAADGDAGGQPQAKDKGAPGKVKQSKASGASVAEYEPPARLTAAQKQVFNKLPIELKQHFSEMIKGHEATFTRTQTEAQKAYKESQHILEAVRPYYTAHPVFAEKGITESQLVSRLIAAHQKLTHEDPAKRLAEYVDIGKRVGVSEEILQSILDEAGVKKSNGGPSPELTSLQNEVNVLKSQLKSQEQKEFQAHVSSIAEQFKSVMNETNAAGEYLYPELHDAAFREQVKPLVSAIAGTASDYADALKRAYTALTGKAPGASSNGNQTKLPAANNRAREAAVSVRGGNGISVASGNADDIPPEALGSAYDSVRWALKQLHGGR